MLKNEKANEVGHAAIATPASDRVCILSVSVSGERMVELTGIEPVTPCLQSRCSPS